MIVLYVVAYFVGTTALAVALGRRLEQLHRAQTRRDEYKRRANP